jgi:hypothetical protein
LLQVVAEIKSSRLIHRAVRDLARLAGQLGFAALG